MVPHRGRLIKNRVLASLWLMANQESFRGVADQFNLNKGTLHHHLVQVVTGLTQLVLDCEVVFCRATISSADRVREKDKVPWGDWVYRCHPYYHQGTFQQ